MQVCYSTPLKRHTFLYQLQERNYTHVSLKLRQLDSKILTLQTQHKNLLKDRSQEIAVLITSLELAPIEDNILLGGLLFLKEKITTQDPTGLALVEAWRPRKARSAPAKR